MMNFRSPLASFHSLVCLVFFLLVIMGTVLSFHPLFLLVSLVGSILLYLSLRGFDGLKTMLRLLPLSLAVLILNPLFNASGNTILFHYFGRPFTLEALLYGISIAGMILSVLIWCLSLNLILTSDRFLSLSAPLLPAFSLLVVLVLRLLPSFFRRSRQILADRKAIGKGQEATLKERMLSGFAALSALSGWAMESSIVTADSMKARGYGSGKRSSFRMESFQCRDLLLLILFLFLAACHLFGMLTGGMEVLYIPAFTMASLLTPGFLPGFLSFTVLCLMPTFLSVYDFLIHYDKH